MPIELLFLSQWRLGKPFKVGGRSQSKEKVVLERIARTGGKSDKTQTLPAEEG